MTESRQWLPWGERLRAKRYEGTYCYNRNILHVDLNSDYKSVYISQTIHLKWLYFILCKLYFNKVDFKQNNAKKPNFSSEQGSTEYTH